MAGGFGVLALPGVGGCGCGGFLGGLVGEQDEAVGGDFLAGVGGGVDAVSVPFFYGGDCL